MTKYIFQVCVMAQYVMGEVGRREGKNQQRAEGAHGRDAGGQESARTRLEAAVQKLTIPSLPPEAARQNTLEKKSTRESKP